MRASTQYMLCTLCAALCLVACAAPYSPASYRAQDPEQQYAIVCHAGKKTLQVLAEDWPAHRAHGDYRGPCRARGVAGNTSRRKIKHTATSYTDRQDRDKASVERFELAATRAAAVRDSTIASQEDF